MTCLLDEVLDGPGTKSHTSLLGTFFVYTLGPRILIFKKKFSLKRLGKSSKISIVVTLQQWKFWNFFPDVSGKIFSWKLEYVVPRCIQKTSPTEKYVTSFLARPELRLVSKSLKCFTNRVVKFMKPCVHTLPPKSLHTPISVYAIKHAWYSSLGRGKGSVDIFVNWGRF